MVSLSSHPFAFDSHPHPFASDFRYTCSCVTLTLSLLHQTFTMSFRIGLTPHPFASDFRSICSLLPNLFASDSHPILSRQTLTLSFRVGLTRILLRRTSAAFVLVQLIPYPFCVRLSPCPFASDNSSFHVALTYSIFLLPLILSPLSFFADSHPVLSRLTTHPSL